MNQNLFEAFRLLEKKYYKILKININDDSFIEIKTSLQDKEIIKSDFKDWVCQFVANGFIHPQDQEAFLKTILDKRFKEMPLCFYYRRLGDDSKWHWVCMETDFCEDKQYIMLYIRDTQDGYNLALQKEFEYNSKHDALTNLCNQRKYLEDCSQLNKKMKYLNSIGILYMDLNNLKETNDTCGHAAGDKIIKNFSNILKETFRLNDCYRIGGDEFIVFLENIQECDFYCRLSELYKAIAANDSISVSIGSSWIDIRNNFNNSADTIETYILKTEEKMYEAKRKYKRIKEQ